MVAESHPPKPTPPPSRFFFFFMVSLMPGGGVALMCHLGVTLYGSKSLSIWGMIQFEPSMCVAFNQFFC